MISFRNAASAAATIAAAAAIAPCAHAQTTLTMSSWVSPAHHLTSVVLQGYGDEVEKASGGRIKFQMLPKHPSAAPGTFDAVRDGLVDVSYVTASYTPARHVLPLIAELPGGGDTAEINSVAFSRVHWKYLHQAGEYKGVHLFGFFINEDKWNKFSKEDQALLTKFGGEYLARRAGKSWDNVDRIGNEGLRKAGAQIDTPNAALVKEIQAKAQPVIQGWIKEVKEKRNMDGAMLLKEFHAELNRAAAS